MKAVSRLGWVLLITTSCVAEKTSPEASEALANAMLTRIDDRYPRSLTEGAGIEWLEAHRRDFIQRHLFSGVHEGIKLDAGLKGLMGEFWAPNVMMVVPNPPEKRDLPNEGWIAERKAWTQRYRQRLIEFRDLLQKRIERGPADAAARGLYGIGLLWILEEKRLEVNIEVTHLINEIFLAGQVELKTPPCPCRNIRAGTCIRGGSDDCHFSAPSYAAVRDGATQLAASALNDIHAINPNSSWLELARRFTHPDGPTGCSRPGCPRLGVKSWAQPDKLPRLSGCSAKPPSDAIAVAFMRSSLYIGNVPYRFSFEAHTLAETARRARDPFAASFLSGLSILFKKGLTHVESGQTQSWRQVPTTERAPIACKLGNGKSSETRYLPQSYWARSVSLVLEPKAISLGGVEAAACVLFQLGHPVTILGMTEHGPSERPWDHPQMCSVPYPCRQGSESNAACEGLLNALEAMRL